MTNKEVAEKLRAFYSTQDHKDLAHLCAAFALDINRFLHFEMLSAEKREDLMRRSAINMQNVLISAISDHPAKLKFSEFEYDKENYA